MSSLNVTVSVQEGKNETRKLTSFVIGGSVVKAELADLSKEARQEKIQELARKFLTPQQQKLNFLCTVTDAAASSKKDKSAATAPAAEATPEAGVEVNA